MTVTIGITGLAWARTASPPRPGGGPRPPASAARWKADLESMTVRLKTKQYRVNLRVANDTDCATHSYGEVHRFFRSTPCRYLSRAVFELRDKSKNVVLIAVSEVDMPNTDAARRYQALVDADGTGNVTELSREHGRYRRVRYSGRIYSSSRDGVTVRNIQVEPVGWWPGRAARDAINKAIAPGTHAQPPADGAHA